MSIFLVYNYNIERNLFFQYFYLTIFKEKYIDLFKINMKRE